VKFGWQALFRDERLIECPSFEEEEHFVQDLVDYLYGTLDNPKKHYLEYFSLYVNGQKYTVDFDFDGDAYISTPDDRILMTDYKIRSSRPIYSRIQGVYCLGFEGINTCGDLDGKAVAVLANGNYIPLSYATPGRAIIKIERNKEIIHDSSSRMV